MNIPDKALKCLNLALNDSAPEGEWNAAAIRFCAILRKNSVGIESFSNSPKPAFAYDRPDYCHKEREARKKPTKRAPKAAKAEPVGVMPFGKFKGQDISSLPDWYLNWCLDQEFIKEPLKSEIQKESEIRAEKSTATQS